MEHRKRLSEDNKANHDIEIADKILNKIVNNKIIETLINKNDIFLAKEKLLEFILWNENEIKPFYREYKIPSVVDIFKTDLSFREGVCLKKKNLSPSLCYGKNFPKFLIKTTSSAPFSVDILERLMELNFPGPCHIQKLVWPAIFRNRNVVAIAPPHCGKTLAYLLPVLSEILQIVTTIEFEEQRGPVALVICSDWRNAQSVYDQCKLLIGKCEINVIAFYSGGNVKSQMFPLRNSCALLITTPLCFFPLLKHKEMLIDIKECAFLIFDDADNLINKYPKFVFEMINLYVKVMSYRSKQYLPSQILIASECWNNNLSSFVSNYIQDPLIYITSFREAAVYAQIPTICHTCTESDSSNKLINILKNIQKNKIIIATFSSETSLTIYNQIVKHKLGTVLFANNFLQKQELTDISDKWKQNTSRIILIVEDNVFVDLNICDAECLIHYDLPNITSFAFSFRYSVMSNFLSSKKASSCTCHFLITKDCHKQAINLIKFLERIPAKIPDVLNSVISNFQQLKEQVDVQLCNFLKALGHCPQKSKCWKRHTIINSIDKPVVPKCGVIRVFITKVLDATRYYARIIEHSDPESECKLSGTSYLTLNTKMMDYFSLETNRIHPKTIKIHRLYAIQMEYDVCHRVLIKSITEYNNNEPLKVLVDFIDDGWIEEVDVKNLLELPFFLTVYPSQLIEVYACCVQSKNANFEWTYPAIATIRDKIEQEEVTGKILLALARTVWLHPIIHHIKIDICNVSLVNTVVHHTLLQNDFGIKNPDHVKCLYKSCEGVINLPEVKTVVPKIADVTNESYAFLELNTYHHVYIYSIENPGRFFLQRIDFIRCLESISNELEKMILKNQLKKPKLITKNLICAGPFISDNRWYRAFVKEIINSKDEVKVRLFFPDFGDEDEVRIEDIFSLPPEMLLLPFQAIECSLAGVSPPQGGWSKESVEIFKNFTFENDVIKCLTAKALQWEPSINPKLKKYFVQLWDLSIDRDINLAEELIKHNQAISSDLPLIPYKSIDQNCDVSYEERKKEFAFYSAIAYAELKTKIERYQFETKQLQDKSNVNEVAKQEYRNEVKSVVKKNKEYRKSILNIQDVEWWQTKTNVIISILIIGIKNYDISLNDSRICFTAITSSGRICSFVEDLFAPIIPEKYHIKIEGCFVTISLVKCLPEQRWLHLTSSKDGYYHICENVEFNHLDDNEMNRKKYYDDEIDSYDYDNHDEENLSEDDMTWEYLTQPLDPYDMLSWD